jgi:hypothetical protein
MMHFLGRRQLTSLPALLTQRMRLDVSAAYLSPCTAVPFGSCRVTLVLVVMPVDDRLMLFTVPTMGKAWTSGVTAGPFRSGRHGAVSFWVKEKDIYHFQ